MAGVFRDDLSGFATSDAGRSVCSLRVAEGARFVTTLGLAPVSFGGARKELRDPAAERATESGRGGEGSRTASRSMASRFKAELWNSGLCGGGFAGALGVDAEVVLSAAGGTDKAFGTAS